MLTDVPQSARSCRRWSMLASATCTWARARPRLSGGEAQRMKLARELSKRQTGRTLYLLDEPTTGLHFDDVRKLLEVLHRLADLGNSVIIIEHNLDVIRNADWILDLGPEGGEDGGRVVAEGRPAKVAATAGSYTGQFLKRYYTSSAGYLVEAEPEEDVVSVESGSDAGGIRTSMPSNNTDAVAAGRSKKGSADKSKAPRKAAPWKKKLDAHERLAGIRFS